MKEAFKHWSILACRTLFFAFTVAGIIYVGSKSSFIFQQGNADIYSLLDRPDKKIPDFREGDTFSDIGESIINGVKFSYSVEVVDAPISDIIEYYKDLYSPTALRLFTDSFLEKAGVKENDKAAKIIQGFERFFSDALNPVFSQQTETWGFLGALDRGDNDKWFIKKTDDIFDEVVGKAVIAIKPSPDSEQTTVIKYWSESRLDLEKLIPSPGKDSEGFDLPDVDRHPYSLRLFSMAQKDKYGANAFVMYLVDDNPQSVMLFTLSDLRANNWIVSEAAEESSFRVDEPNYIFATKDNRELNVFVSVSDTGGTLLTLMER